MRKYAIYVYKDCKVIYDLGKHLKRRHKSTIECHVKKFPVETSDEKINEYIDKKLGGNPEIDILGL